MRRNRVLHLAVAQRNLLFCAGVFLFVLCAAPNLTAAQEVGGAVPEGTAEFFKWINFALVAGALVWVYRKILRPRFRANADTIESAIRKATSAKAAADVQLGEAETKLANLQKEVAELRASTQHEFVAEVERLHIATQNDVLKISASAKAEIEAAERAARLELKAIAAQLAVDGAESLIANQLTPQAQEALVSNFVKSLPGRPN
jgi:F-type H+-transporting ATPase subunit b